MSSNEKMKKQISIGAIISYLTIGINILIGLFYTPWMIHQIGDSNYSLYTIALSIINIFLIDFGLSSATSRFLAKYYAKNEYSKANEFLGITLKLYLVIDVILFIILLLIYLNLSNIYIKLTENEICTLRGLYAIVGFFSIFSFPFINVNGILVAQEKFITIKVCGLFQKISTSLLVVGSLLCGGNVYTLVLINSAVGMLVTIYKLIYVTRNGVRYRMTYRSKDMIKSIIDFSAWSTVVQITQRVIFSLAPTILAMFVKASDIVFFSLASTIEGYVWNIGDAINGMFISHIARIDNSNQSNDKISELMIQVGKFQITIIGLIYVVFMIIGKQFVFYWMGKGYELVYICTLLILFPSLLDIPQQVGKTTLLIRNKVKLEAYVYLIMVTIYIPISLILTKCMGVVGTSLAVLIAYVCRSFLLMYIYYQYLQLDVFSFIKNIYFKWTGILVLSYVSYKVLDIIISTPTLENMILKIIFVTVIYLLLTSFLLMSRSERRLIYVLIKKRGQK